MAVNHGLANVYLTWVSLNSEVTDRGLEGVSHGGGRGFESRSAHSLCLVTRAWLPACASGVCDLEQDIGMAWNVQWAVASEISAVKFESHVMDFDRQPSCNEIFPVAPHCFRSSQCEWVRVSPFRGPGHDDCVWWKSRSLFAGSPKSSRNGHAVLNQRYGGFGCQTRKRQRSATDSSLHVSERSAG